MKISDRLSLIRDKLGLTQPAAAMKFHMPLPSWKSYEKGPSEPGAGALRGLAEGGININWLLTGQGEMLLDETKLASDNQQASSGLIDSDLLSEIAFRFEVALKARIEEDGTAAWILAQSAFPGLTSDDERPTKEEFDAFFESCAQRFKLMGVIGSTYNYVVGEQDKKERDRAITDYSLSCAAFINNPQLAKAWTHQIDELREKIFKDEATQEDEKLFFSLINNA